MVLGYGQNPYGETPYGDGVVLGTKRNLAINPSAEQGFNTAWEAPAASTQVFTNSFAVGGLPAKFGTKVGTFFVTDDAATGVVSFNPRGPDDSIHHGYFALSTITNSVSAMVWLAAADLGLTTDVWVQPRARFMAWNGTSFVVTSQRVLGDPVLLEPATDLADWVRLDIYGAQDTTATHWTLDLVVSTTDPRIVYTTPPAATTVYFDGMYLSESGESLIGQDYLDGDQTGGYWEGQAHNSSSIYYVLETPDEEEDPEDPTDVEEDPDDTEIPSDDPSDTPGGEQPTAPINPPYVLTKVDIAERMLARQRYGDLCLNADVQLGELIFNDIDEFGNLWVVTDIEGWWNLPEPDMPDFVRGREDGSYEARGRYNSRVFTLSGKFLPRDPAQLAATRNRLINATNLCHFGAWFATKEVEATKASRVFLSGKPEISTTKVNGLTDFSIGLKAPDPIKYGLEDGELPGFKSVSMVSKTTTQESNGRTYNRNYNPEWSYGSGVSSTISTEGVADNRGNTNVFPVLELVGPTTGTVIIRNLTTGQEMRVVKAIAPNNTLYIDCMNKTVSLDGARNQRSYVSLGSDWLWLAPGVNRFVWQDVGSTASTGTLTVKWRSGWIG